MGITRTAVLPQGSVAWPLLFTAYTASLNNVTKEDSPQHHLYAQLYIAFKPRIMTSREEAISAVQAIFLITSQDLDDILFLDIER